MLLDVDRRVHVLLDELFGNQDRVLVVITFPRHEADQDVAAERDLAALGRCAVRDDVALLDAFAVLHDRALVEAGALVGAAEL